MSNANSRQIDGNHYQMEYQHWDFMADNRVPYLEASITKYLSRWKKKKGHQDVLKAIHYLDKLQEVWASRSRGSAYRTGPLSVSRVDFVHFFTQDVDALGTLEMAIFENVFYSHLPEELEIGRQLLQRLFVRAKEVAV